MKTLPTGEKDPKTSSMCICSSLQIGTCKVKMSPKNIYTFLGQNCSSNTWLHKLDMLFASLTVFQEVEGSIISVYQSCKICRVNWLCKLNWMAQNCTAQCRVHCMLWFPKVSQASQVSRNSPSLHPLSVSQALRSERTIDSFFAIETTEINQVQIHPVQETVNSTGSEALG